MTHRSNQAVESQDQVLSQPQDRPPPGRLLIGWATALAALCLSSAILAGGLWLARRQIAEFFIGAALSERGADADFRVAALDFGGVTLADIRFGPATSPDASVAVAVASWSWEGLSPRLETVRLVSPRLRLGLDPAGKISAGTLERIGGAPGQRPALPAIRLDVEDGQVRLDAPFGAVEAAIEGGGVLGQDFSALARIAPTTQASGAFALKHGAGELAVTSHDGALAFRFDAAADEVLWDGLTLQAARLRIEARAPLDLSPLEARATWRASTVGAAGITLAGVEGGGEADAQVQTDRLALADWRGSARLESERAGLAGVALINPRVEFGFSGDDKAGRGGWSLVGDRFEGLGIVANSPNAAGDFLLSADRPAFTGHARLRFSQARLSQGARRGLRLALPELGGAPVGPVFAQAYAAIERAGAAFELSAPFSWRVAEGHAELRMAGAAEIRAASGAHIAIAPLREDAPAMLMQWPGASLHGAVAIELSGGGAPQAALLLDSMDWAPDAPFEAEGALSIPTWQVQNSAIAADEVDIALTLPREGGGRLEIAGPVRISGPLGAGAVRDLSANLDLTASWRRGWRVTTSGDCLPVRFVDLQAGGLTFSNGALSLCPHEGALIAANAHGALSGGFVIRTPSLSGRLGAGEPAQAEARAVSARFSGTPGDMRVSVDALAPTLTVTLGEQRKLILALQHLDAEAQVTRDWRIAGGFTQGALSDPNLLGTVTAIAGAWSAAPMDGAALIRVDAGEALITANRAASQAERPLFNPIRMSGVSAVFRDGRIDAEGALLLEAQGRRLAGFTATHRLGEGRGGAHVVAADLRFDQGFQPYDITERLRGMVENVRGAADLEADIAWTGQSVAARGSARLNAVSLATATIPVVENVQGEVTFDNLFALTTPPGQSVSVGLVNPGVAARDGRVQFQLLGDQRVAIERAEFAYAGGVLALAPTIVTLGAEETRFELTLAGVNADDLVQSLNIPDLAATGRVEGRFPLLLSRRAALIEDGVLRALPGGGVISYVGHAGDGATGPARIAFDALRSFRYDKLQISLDGDLGGEVISSIEFSGENTGEPVDLGPIAPGLGNVSVRGVPFDFNVRVTAPFRRLAQTAASVTDPGVILDRGRDQNEEPVDQGAPAPR